ncbi:tautomerase family protein [Methylibium petroleiphilum]|uniref:tautomerase family protein n=1 Tax=Methylibium petroleiphilum TaxID=105560 RepID=UPI003D2964EC
MPTYVVTAPQGRLSMQQKERIAADITRVHCTVASAPAYFAQVIFNDVLAGNYFVGGKLLQRLDHVYVHGQIRAGRDGATKEQLVLELMNAVADAAEMPTHCVQIYVVDVPARQIAEYGQLLPLPGDEAEWWDAIPVALRKHMEAIGE